MVDERRRRILKWAFTDPDRLKPGKTRQQLTEEAAVRFASLAQRLRERGHEAHLVAHFVNRMVFCMFAEDVNLLPRDMFRRMLEQSLVSPAEFAENAKSLFAAMRQGGRVGFERVEWFNGGIFDDDIVLPLQKGELQEALLAAELDWSNIDPSIMGTLFERGLDPGKRSQLGAHYTNPEKIQQIIGPAIIEPLTAEWILVKAEIASLMEKSRARRDKAQQTRAFNDARTLPRDFIERLKRFRVLDPACGSGNFLYMALLAIKDLEHRANLDVEALGLPRDFPTVGPECVRGIELNPFAAELARVSIWIGEIQWMLRNGFDVSRSPILKNLDNIICNDALLNDGSEFEWPSVDAIVGNPPFLGNKKMNRVLTPSYVRTLKRVYRGRVPGGADFVTYWFQKAWEQVRDTKTKKAGLVGTQAIRRGASRKILQKIVKDGRIFDAWSDEEWTVEGADVRVSLVCFSGVADGPSKLNGKMVDRIAPELVESSEVELPVPLAENKGVAFQGTISGGPFEIAGEQARLWLNSPQNPDGSRNEMVLRPWRNADDVTDRASDTWIIDFPAQATERDAAMWELPFKYLKDAWEAENKRLVAEGKSPLRENEPRLQAKWWQLQRPRPKLRLKLPKVNRYIATPRVAKYRTFSWLATSILPDTRVVVIVREDDSTFGILQSKYHELWTLRYGARHGVGNDPEYVHTQTFETFPFPDGLTPNIPAIDYAEDPRARAIAAAAKRLNELRENWLNPPDLVKAVPEVVSGYPDRIVPVNEQAASLLRRRTVTQLYNERPAWLGDAHDELNLAVAAAYGWPAELSDEQILAKLLALNKDRVAVHQKKSQGGKNLEEAPANR